MIFKIDNRENIFFVSYKLTYIGLLATLQVKLLGDFRLLFPPIALHGTHACLYISLDLDIALFPLLFQLMLREANLNLLAPEL